MSVPLRGFFPPSLVRTFESNVRGTVFFDHPCQNVQLATLEPILVPNVSRTIFLKCCVIEHCSLKIIYRQGSLKKVRNNKLFNWWRRKNMGQMNGTVWVIHGMEHMNQEIHPIPTAVGSSIQLVALYTPGKLVSSGSTARSDQVNIL